MNYIIYDLEWNQPMDERTAIREPFYFDSEIIEIGAVKLDEHFCLIDQCKLYIAPRFYPKLHRHIASLTGIHDKLLAQQGIPFPEAYERFTAWCGEEYTFMTWSMSDLPVLIDNLLIHGMDASKLPPCCDIQRIFSREILRSQVRYSLDNALAMLGETGETAHDALHDAKNTIKVCDHLDLEEYLPEYTAQVFALPPDGSSYESPKSLLEDPALCAFDCPWCGESVTCEDWISFSGSTCMAYGQCSEGDEFLVQLSIVRQPKGTYCAKRILFEVSDDLWEVYMDRKEETESR